MTQTETLIVNGQQQNCTLHILSASELANSPLLDPVVQMQNRAFASASRQPILPATTARYRSIEQYLDDKGDAATTFVLASDSGEEIYGAISIGPYVDSAAVLVDAAVPVQPGREFKRPPLAPALSSEARWLLCCLAVSPAVQKQGLARRLLALAEDYAVAQSKGKTVRVMLSCIKENNGAFYGRRGFCAAEERRMPSGFLESEAGFTILFMDKFINPSRSESAGSLAS